MLLANIITGVAALLWGGLVWLGSNVALGVARQNAPNYPNAAQLAYYIGFPAGVLAILIIGAIVFNRLRWPAGYLGALSGLAIVCVLPFLFFYTGGV